MKKLALLTLSVALFNCGGCGPGGPGDSCDLDDTSSCEEGLVCSDTADGAVCLIPIGDACNPKADEKVCAGDSECVENEDASGGTCLVTASGECEDSDQCAGDLVCADTGDTTRCWADVRVRGVVFDSETNDGIEGAHVIALDDESTAVSDVAISGDAGAYELSIPVARNEDGEPLDEIFTLRAGAQDYFNFPGGIRTALPVDASTATREDDGPWILSNAVTDIALLVLPDDQLGQPSISGSVTSDVRRDGVLVVAEGGLARSAVTSIAGDFTIFNVPSGAYEVRGYAAGVQLEPASVDVDSDAVTGVELADAGDTTATVDGSIQLVNGGRATSVVLVVASTFNDLFARGEVPSGLRAPKSGPPDVTGAWSIEGVPAGEYVVLAAFENDLSVRDPDQAISGTAIVRITVAAGADQTIGESFKVTEALAIFGPGADEPEGVAAPPTLRWQDDSSEKFYEVRVYSAYGEEVWNNLMVPGVSGGDTVSVDYNGPFDDGMYYQFRATSFREPGGTPTPISTTEDLLGVFYKVTPE